MSIKVILDTDIGSDIDDAVCLAYLLAHPACDLLGITTVSGEAEKRAMMASAQCAIAGKRVPIYPGVEQPLLIPSLQPVAQQAKMLSNWQHDTTFPQGEAIEFLRRTIHAHPGEIVLLGIGPLTNLALLFAIDSSIPGLLKSLVLMGGTFEPHVTEGTLPRREWNILNDPHAAAMVYRASVQTHRSVGLNVTTQVTMKANEFRTRCQHIPLLQPVLDFAKVWFEHSDTVTFHDPLAATTIFQENICTFSRGTVEVEVSNKSREGETTFTPEGTTHEVAFEVDAQRFFTEYFGVLEHTSHRQG